MDTHRNKFQRRLRQYLNRNKESFRLRIIKYHMLSKSERTYFYNANKNVRKYDLYDWSLLDQTVNTPSSSSNAVPITNTDVRHSEIRRPLNSIPELIDRSTQKDDDTSSSDGYVSVYTRSSDNDDPNTHRIKIYEIESLIHQQEQDLFQYVSEAKKQIRLSKQRRNYYHKKIALRLSKYHTNESEEKKESTVSDVESMTESNYHEQELNRQYLRDKNVDGLDGDYLQDDELDGFDGDY